MSLFFFTFGQVHAHSINGKTFDKDCVAVVQEDNEEGARRYVREATNNQYHESFDIKRFTKKEDMMRYYPRGLIPMNFRASIAELTKMIEEERELNA